MNYIQLEKLLKQKYPLLEIQAVDPSIFIFEKRVLQKCFHCKNYNYKWTCPPQTPNIDYSIMFKEYKSGALIIGKFNIQDDSLDNIRSISTNTIHKSLLYLEKNLYNLNESMAISFIGGSCKLCKNGCNEKKCSNPYLSRMPLEATGCNVVDSLKKININITFPISDTLYRYGLLLW